MSKKDEVVNTDDLIPKSMIAARIQEKNNTMASLMIMREQSQAQLDQYNEQIKDLQIGMRALLELTNA